MIAAAVLFSESFAMNRPLRSLVVTLLVGLMCGALLLTTAPVSEEIVAADVLQAEGDMKWYKGNLHTHSLWSDGDDYLEMIGLWYKEHGYDFLCFTDHNVLSTNRENWKDVLNTKGGQQAYDKLKARFPEGWVDERVVDGRLQVRLKTFPEVDAKIGEPGKFLLIQGEEITDRFQNFPVHMNATNVRELIPPLGGESVYETIQNNTNALIAQRERTGVPMLIHLNHPNFGYGVTAEDLMRVRGEDFFEVYNGHPGVRNSGDAQHASTDRIWDIILTRRLTEFGLPIMYGLATDDGHNYHNIPSRASEPGRGWVMVLSSALTPAALIEALEAGRFYSTSGVTLEKVVSGPSGLEVEVQPEPGVTYKIEFIGTKRDYDRTSQPVVNADGEPIRATLRYSDELGQVFKTVEGTQAAYQFADDDVYVRAIVTSSKPHPNPSEVGEYERAWAQPVKGPGAPNFD
jgi:hypothetical protein